MNQKESRMGGIIDKVRDLFKCKAEKSTKSVPRQEEPKAEEKTEERSRSAEETASDK